MYGIVEAPPTQMIGRRIVRSNIQMFFSVIFLVSK